MNVIFKSIWDDGELEINELTGSNELCLSFKTIGDKPIALNDKQLFDLIGYLLRVQADRKKQKEAKNV